MKSLKFGLEGAGTMPSITLQTQLDKPSKGGVYTINLGKTHIGFTKKKSILIGNEGLIPAKIAIIANASPDFEHSFVHKRSEFIAHVACFFIGCIWRRKLQISRKSFRSFKDSFINELMHF